MMVADTRLQAAQTNRPIPAVLIVGPPPSSGLWNVCCRVQRLSLPVPSFNHLPPLHPLDLTEWVVLYTQVP